VIFTTPRFAPYLSKKGIAPWGNRGVTGWTPRSPCTKGYRAVAKRRSAYAAMPVLPALSMFSVRTQAFAFNPGFFQCSLCVLCALCASRVLIFGTNENRGIAPSQKEEALTPRCPCAVHRWVTNRIPRSAPCLSKKGIAPSQKEEALTPRCLSSPRSPCSLCEPKLLLLIQAFFSVLSVFSVPSVRAVF